MDLLIPVDPVVPSHPSVPSLPLPQLAKDNEYCTRFLNAARENVIGSNGIGLQIALPKDLVSNADKLNREIETAWERWSEQPTCDQQMSIVDAEQLWIASKLQDGEMFTRRVVGYPHNRFRFALDYIDPDRVDLNWNRLRRPEDLQEPNEIRMGVELDEWRRPVAYWLYEGHPSEMAGVKRVRVPASQVDHAYIFKRMNQTRGVPWLHAAMSRMTMMYGYDDAEMTASRLAASKMAFLVSKTGDEYSAGRKEKDGATSINAEPGLLEELPEGIEPRVIDWQHPAHNYPEFTMACLRGVAVGLNVSYTTLTGDLRAVNFSSIRQGILAERDGWRVLQKFTIDHFCRPTFGDWLRMAVTTGQLELPPRLPLNLVIESAVWTPRGWDWVDPYKDAQADIIAVRSGMTSLADVAAKRGQDWEVVLERRAKEIQRAKELGVPIDLTGAGSGAGGIEGGTSDETGEKDEGAGATPPKPPKPNGKANGGRFLI